MCVVPSAMKKKNKQKIKLFHPLLSSPFNPEKNPKAFKWPTGPYIS
jgi:hypothetical protein